MKKEIVKIFESSSSEFALILSVAMILLLFCVGFLVGSKTSAFGFLVGGGVAILNHFELYRSLRKVLSNTPRNGSIKGIPLFLLGFYLRLFISAIVIYGALQGGWANPLCIIIGVSVVFINCFGLGLILASFENENA
jgi:hypothetical protein